MSASTAPITATAAVAPARPPVPWAPAPEPDADLGRLAARAAAAVARYKWLVLALVLAGTAGGLAAARFLPKRYEVKATIFINQGPTQNGPIRARELLDARAWTELATSYAILDAVVARMQLWLVPSTPADSAALVSLRPALPVRPGHYTLRVGADGAHYALSWQRDDQAAVVERGAVGDSIGRGVGFRWAPAASVLPRGRELAFDVVSPRDASAELSKQLEVWLADDKSNFLWLQLRGTDPQRTAATMNVLLEEFVSAAAALKRKNLSEFVSTLDSQRTYAAERLRKADRALEEFKVSTITLPSENVPVVPGIAEARDPVFKAYFEQKIEFDNVRHDREALEGLLNELRLGAVPPDQALLSVPSVLTASDELKAVLQELSQKHAQLRAARQVYTDEYKTVQDLKRSIATLETQTIPALAGGVLDQLRRREGELGRRISGASRELQSIPTRTIEEMRLRREVEVASTLYTTLQSRYQEARLAEASAIPDVSVMDQAVPPQRPSRDLVPRVLGGAVAGSLALGLVLAMLLDRTDKRLRYPEQATSELGLEIVGAVPTIRRAKGGQPSMEETSEIIEAFRSLRLNVRNAFPAGAPVMLTVSSPGAGDGKSLLSSNLALSFAEAGFRTVLVDGDIRRGGLHAMFGVSQRPGLIDYLAGDAGKAAILRETTHHNLTLISSGTRRHRGPELLASDGMARLVRELGTEFDAVIVDSAPLGAGIDPFALGVATGHMLVVLRAGETNRQLAEAKLAMLDRLPVQLLGTVLNDFRSPSLYKYYAYLDGYGTLDDDEMPTVLARA